MTSVPGTSSAYGRAGGVGASSGDAGSSSTSATALIYGLIRDGKHGEAVAVLSAQLQAFPRSRAALSLLPQVSINAAAHAQEHSLEVHLPFLQTVLAGFTVVPLAVGDASAEEVAQVIDTLWGGPETLIIVSSDLSHYLNYAEAQLLDSDTAQAIVDLRSDISHEQACGGTPVNGLALAARRHHLTADLIDLRNSGDTAGDRQRVVGYGAFVFCANNNGKPHVH